VAGCWWLVVDAFTLLGALFDVQIVEDGAAFSEGCHAHLATRKTCIVDARGFVTVD